MEKQIDLNNDWLAGAHLTQEQRHIWNLVREELQTSRALIQEMDLQLKTLKQQIDQEGAIHSVLTRPEFNREVARMLAFDERYGGLSSVLYFDFDNLPELTKFLGNEEANKIVKIICETLSKNIRTSDIVGRLATNEFGILLVRCDNENAWKKAEALSMKLRQALPAPVDPRHILSISYGAYTFHENEDASGGLRNAAQAITQAPKA